MAKFVGDPSFRFADLPPRSTVIGGAGGFKPGNSPSTAEGSPVAAYVALGLGGAAALGFVAWLATREPEPRARRGRR